MRLIVPFILLLSAASPAMSQTTDERSPETTEAFVAALGNMLVQKAKTLATTAAEAEPNDIMTPNVITAALTDNKYLGSPQSITHKARYELFQSYQCAVFSHFEEQDNWCFWALNREGVASAYEKIGLPGYLADLTKSMRTSLFETGRRHLAEPQQLYTTYERLKPTIMANYQTMFYAEQATFRDMLDKAEAAFVTFIADPTARNLRQEFLNAERMRQWDSKKELEAQLGEMVDVDWFLFAGRRYAEGGNNLLQAYREMFVDLKQSIEPKN